MGRQQVRLKREKLYRTGDRWPIHLRGFGGVNAAGPDRDSDPWVAQYAVNWTNRQGLYGNKIGGLSTRPGIAPVDHYNLPGFSGEVPTNNPVRALHKFYPSNNITTAGEMCRVVSNQFQVNDGSGWTNKSGAFTFNNTTAYPQILELGWPSKHLLIANPGTPASQGGLYVYDGTNYWKQSIDRYGGASEVNSLRWLCQGSDGRAYVCGDYIDDDEPLVVHYSAPGTVGTHTDPTNKNQWLYPNGGLFLVYAQGPRGKSGPTRITGMAWLNGYVLIFTEVGRYIVSNPGTGSERVDYLPGYGCLNGNLVCEDEYSGRVMWWDAYGGYTWTGSGLPSRVSQPIWPHLGNIAMKDGSGDYIAQKMFSFTYLGQWWTQLRTSGLTGISTSSTPGELGHDLNTNFIFDFITGQWYIANIPMTCATVAQSGLDLGQMYFASPVDKGTNQYYTYRYGFDEAASQAVYADHGEDIYAYWKTPKLVGEDLMRKKQYEKIRVNAEVTAGATPIGASIKCYYDGGVAVPVTWPVDPNADVVHDLGMSQNYGNYLEIEWEVTSQRRTTIHAAEYTYVPVMTDG
jgi:hypothetical protein